MTPISNKSSSQYYNYMKKCVICLLFNVRMASPEVVGVALTKVGFLVVCLPSNHPCTGGGHKKSPHNIAELCAAQWGANENCNF